MSEPSTRAAVGRARPAVRPPGGKRVGVVVGIDQYRDARLNLRCARADALALHALMIDPECGACAEGDVPLLLDEAATKDAIWRALADLRRKVGPEDDLWIYYAGHAAPEDGTVYWVAHDSDVDNLYATGVPPIGDVLSRVQAQRVLVMLDCCHAAATALQQNKTRDVLTERAVFGQYEGRGRITLAASDGAQRSVELGEVGHGAFTWFLMEGMRGGADTEGQGVVTADHLWRFLNGKVREASRKVGVTQTPVLIGETTHDFAVSINPRLSAHRRTLIEAVKERVGLGEGQLSTEQGRALVAIIEAGPKTPAEAQVLHDLEAVVAGSLKTGVFQRLLEPALAHAAAPVAPAEVRAPAPEVVPPNAPTKRRWPLVLGLLGAGGALAAVGVAVSRSTPEPPSDPLVAPAPSDVPAPSPASAAERTPEQAAIAAFRELYSACDARRVAAAWGRDPTSVEVELGTNLLQRGVEAVGPAVDMAPAPNFVCDFSETPYTLKDATDLAQVWGRGNVADTKDYIAKLYTRGDRGQIDDKLRMIRGEVVGD